MSHIAFPRLDETILSRRAAIVERLAAILPPECLIADESGRRAFETDALTAYRRLPLAVALPRSTEEVQRVMRLCRDEKVNVVPRGAGTSLSGGAIPQEDAVVIALTKMSRILEINLADRLARVEAGVTNLAISEAVGPEGFFYAPDPSSQLACTIGGNIAMNSGGAHCLKYGVTTNNLLGVRLVTPDGEIFDIGGEAMDAPGYDLLGLVCGSEGQLGIVTEAIVRLIPSPEGARPVLFGFDSVEEASRCVAAIIGAGIVPVAMEYLDKPAIHICENFAHAGYPLDVEAMLIIEVEGSDAEMGAMLARIGAIAKAHNVRTARESMSAMESAQIWKGRKSAFGATGRVADYICMDGTVPTSRLPEALQAHRRDLRLVRTSRRQRLSRRRRQHASADPLQRQRRSGAGQSRGGGRGHSRNVRRARRLPHRRARGRHREARADGTPIQRRRACAAEAGARRVRSRRAAQSGQGVSAGRARRMSEALKPEREADVVEAVLAARIDRAKLDIAGAGAMAGLGRPCEGKRRLSTAAMSGIVFHAPAEMTLCARAGTPLAAIEAAIAEHGQMLPFEPMRPRALWGGAAEPTLGGMVATNLSGPRRPSAGAVRDGVLGLKLVNGLGQIIRCGGRVTKNVTGLDLTKLNCGAHGTLGVITEATIKLSPRPEAETTLVMPDLDESRALDAMTSGLGSPYGVSGAAWLAPGMGRAYSRTALRLEGFADAVDDRAGRLAALIGEFGRADWVAGEELAALWRSVRDAEFIAAPRDRAVWRVSLAPSRAAPFVAGLGATALARFYDWGGGLVWVATAASETAATAVRRAVASAKGHATLIRAPDALRSAVDVFEPPSALGLTVSRRVKQSFDPDGVLNFGRMYEGI